MSLRQRIVLLVPSLVVALAATASGQATRLSGRWVLDIGKSEYEAVTPVLYPMTLDITVRGQTVVLKTTTMAPSGAETSEWTHTTDQATCLNAGKHFTDLKSTAGWDAGKLVITGEREAETGSAMAGGGDVQESGYYRYNRTDEYSVSPDGKTLTERMTLHTPEGDLKVVLVFKRSA